MYGHVVNLCRLKLPNNSIDALLEIIKTALTLRASARAILIITQGK